MATRAALRTRARLLADQDASDFPTDVQYNLYLDDAKRDVWADLVTAGWPVNYTTQSITASGASQYVIAAGAPVFSVRGAFLVVGDHRSALPRLMERVDAAPQASSPVGYMITIDPAAGTVIRLFPATAGGTVEVDYLPEPAGFANDAELWYGPVRSDRLITLRAASDGVRKEGRTQDAGALMAEYAVVLDKVVQAAAWVDQRNPARIRDVRGDTGRDPFAWDAEGFDL